MDSRIEQLSNRAKTSFEGEDYLKALEFYTEIIEECKAINPFYLFMRGKTYNKLGRKYLNNAREDLLKSEYALRKLKKASAYILRLEAHFILGSLEIQYGADLGRAEYHFVEFLRIVEWFGSKRDIRKELKDFDEMEEKSIEYIRRIDKNEIKPYFPLTTSDLIEEAKEFKELWDEHEMIKMDVQENSKWYLISCAWLNNWREFISSKTSQSTNDSEMSVEHPGMILNEDIIDKAEYIIENRNNPHLNLNLKENLREDDHYHIVNDKVWNFLKIRYGGIDIIRYGIKREDSDEWIIEVNLLKINVHFFPDQQEKDVHVYTVYESRYTKVGDLYDTLALVKDRNTSHIKLWKAPMPSDFEAFYRNNLWEFRKHREIRLDALLLKEKDKILNDIEFSMDDFLIVEWRVQGGFIFEEIEQLEEDEHLNDNAELEEVKDKLDDPTSLDFLYLDLGTLIKSSSNSGLSGLSNLGNTCFMNSALQWMSNTIELTKYFLFGLYKDEINYNNPLGTKGRLAAAYAKLMKELWISHDNRVAPWDVKKAIGTVAYQFQGFAQQDSFELFNYVADTLHEDLNRVKEKPVTEFADSNGRPDDEVSADHWKAFTDRNKSVIVDLMYGQLKSRLICSVCRNISNTFDPYLALSLPIPKNKFLKINIVFFPIDLENDKKVIRMKMNFENKDTVQDLKKKLGVLLKTKNDMLVYNVRRKYLLDERLENDVLLSKLEDEKLIVYEYNVEAKKNWCIIPVSITRESRSMFGNSSYEDVCEPKVFVPRLDQTCSEIRRMIFAYFFPLLKLPEQYQEKYDDMTNKEKGVSMIYDNVYIKTDFGNKKMITFEYEKEHSVYQSMRKFTNFEDSDKTLQEFLESIESDNDFSMRVHFPANSKANLDSLESIDDMKMGSSTISIEDWLEKFRVEELLTEDNKYYCRSCKEHQDTYKKMDIYKLPKILVIQLKRFSKDSSSSKYGGMSRMMGSSKNSDLIDFPIEGLDMSKYLLDKDENKEYIYDLYAVSNHMGSLYGGHYTAHCKNSLKNKWYYFNDSSWGSTSEQDLVCSSAYVLFYRQRE